MDCPKCRKPVGWLFGRFFTKEALKNVGPKEAQKTAGKILYCFNKQCKNYCGKGENFYCPKCKTWELKLIHCANEGWGFRCKCGWAFMVIS